MYIVFKLITLNNSLCNANPNPTQTKHQTLTPNTNARTTDSSPSEPRRP